MKKLLLFTFLFLAGLAYAQDKQGLKDSETLTFYGVDFSKAKTYGTTETLSQFKDAFTGINNLFMSEPKKYDVSKFFKKESTLSLEPVMERINKIEEEGFTATANDYSLTDDDIKAMLSKLDTGSDTGYGAILFAGLLNKGKPEATYNVVLFDIATKEIIANEKITTKARGFGLRNFWAGSVHSALKKVEKMKLY